MTEKRYTVKLTEKEIKATLVCLVDKVITLRAAMITSKCSLTSEALATAIESVENTVREINNQTGVVL